SRGKSKEALRNFPTVKSIAATFRNLAQGPGKIGIVEHFSHFRSTIGNQKCFGGRLIIAKHVNILCKVKRDPFGYRETILRNLNRGSQEFVEFLFPEPVKQFLPSVD